MKKISKLILSLVALILAGQANAQKDNVGIGTTRPDQSAALDVSSTNKGFLMPRLTLQQRNSIQNPAQGLIIYQTDMLSGFYFYDGKEWKALSGMEKSVAGTDGDWTLGGNITSATDFLGTINSQPLYFKTANTWSGVISPSGTNATTALGYLAAPRIATTAVYNTGVGYGVLGHLNAGNVTGSSNTVVGSESMSKITSGSGNVAIGARALQEVTTGGKNFALGGFALQQLQTGNDNVAIGYGALATANSAATNSNIAIGAYALTNNQGGANVGIGAAAGEFKSGNGNVYIGHNAGRVAVATTENNKLYIANSNTPNPLIYGDFVAKFISVGDVPDAKRGAIASSGQYGLLVQKGILTEKIKVATMTSSDWADYVFEKDYKLMSLEEVESFIKENKHLPNVPTTSEMISDGNDLQKTDAKLLEKIEELTLYMIEMNKEIKALKKENEQLKKNIK